METKESKRKASKGKDQTAGANQTGNVAVHGGLPVSEPKKASADMLKAYGKNLAQDYCEAAEKVDLTFRQRAVKLLTDHPSKDEIARIKEGVQEYRDGLSKPEKEKKQFAISRLVRILNAAVKAHKQVVKLLSDDKKNINKMLSELPRDNRGKKKKPVAVPAGTTAEQTAGGQPKVTGDTIVAEVRESSGADALMALNAAIEVLKAQDAEKAAYHRYIGERMSTALAAAINDFHAMRDAAKQPKAAEVVTPALARAAAEAAKQPKAA